ncbi:hypothetical protein BKG94_08595 [Rodentibacter ratti]|nr:hypothetical protein BKG94_08595 [Rodentibacter ratti]
MMKHKKTSNNVIGRDTLRVSDMYPKSNFNRNKINTNELNIGIIKKKTSIDVIDTDTRSVSLLDIVGYEIDFG